MDSTPPYPIGPGQRTLAAIMFTDVVSFSRRVQEEEVATLEKLKVDFEQMQRWCDKHAGTVLKSTGDGLLLYFSSAVQAVGCALQMQQQFAARVKADPDGGNLIHRVGIHLGDVFVSDQDVMGDGVNIAARLQAEAEPGGICISQTVYDVVKNKLELAAVRLPPRGLKNIAEQVPIYRIVLDPASTPAVRPGPVYVPPAPVPPPRSPKLALAGVVVLVLAGAGALVWRAQQEHQDELARSRAAQAEFGALLASKGADALGQAGKTPAAAAPDEVPSAERISEMRAWVDRTLPGYTRDHPLQLRTLSGAIAGESKAFMDTDGRLHFAEGGAVRARALAELKPDVLGTIIVSLVLDQVTPPPRGVILGAVAFAQAQNLPVMATALQAGPSRR